MLESMVDTAAPMNSVSWGRGTGKRQAGLPGRGANLVGRGGLGGQGFPFSRAGRRRCSRRLCSAG